MHSVSPFSPLVAVLAVEVPHLILHGLSELAVLLRRLVQHVIGQGSDGAGLGSLDLGLTCFVPLRPELLSYRLSQRQCLGRIARCDVTDQSEAVSEQLVWEGTRIVASLRVAVGGRHEQQAMVFVRVLGWGSGGDGGYYHGVGTTKRRQLNYSGSPPVMFDSWGPTLPRKE